MPYRWSRAHAQSQASLSDRRLPLQETKLRVIQAGAALGRPRRGRPRSLAATREAAGTVRGASDFAADGGGTRESLRRVARHLTQGITAVILNS